MRFFVVGALLAITWAPRPARAGCPSAGGCLMAKDVTASLDPAEACIDVRVTEDDCQCESWVSLENNCAVNLRAEDFVFGFCMIDGQKQQVGCPEIIPPGSWGAVFLPTDPDGPEGQHQEELSISLSGRQFTLQVAYELRRVETGCGCAPDGTGGGAAWLVWLVAAVVSLRARKPGYRCR